MCGRIIVDYDEVIGVAADSELAEWITGRPDGAESSWNLAPTQQVPIALTSAKDGSRRYETAHWGIIPPWNTDGKPRFTFNARVETVAEKNTFAPSLQAQRCAIAVSGFYEWTGPKGSRVPHAIFGPRPLMSMAGLYRWWKSPAGEWVLTATVLTRASAGVMAELHDRQPVFLEPSLAATWLDPSVVGDAALVGAVSEASVALAGELRHYPVATLEGDGPGLIEAVL